MDAPSPSVHKNPGGGALRFSQTAQSPSRLLRRLGAPLLVMASLAFTGCSTRTLTIESEPPGAEVIVNRQQVGHSPVTIEERYGGIHEIILLKPAYRSTVVFHDTTNFWLDTPPFDAFADLGGAEDHQVLRVTLQKNDLVSLYEGDPEGSLQALRERAEALRERSRAHSDAAPPREPLLPAPEERR